MNIRCLMTTSIIALASASAVQASDIMASEEDPAAIVAFTSAFSWTGFYLGGQVGNLSSNLTIKPSEAADVLDKGITPKLSGFMAGIYAGSNVDLGNGLILGVETDAVWADQKDTKRIATDIELDAVAASSLRRDFSAAGINGYNLRGAIKDRSEKDDDFTFKEKWSGATRMRLGFTVVDRMMPYVSGGIAYAKVQGINEITVTEMKGPKGIAVAPPQKASGIVYDQTKTMVGYTLGAGVDFAVVDNIILRAEYRYSDFGKMKFEKDAYEAVYKTNDFRVGVAYKF
ncbi:outer membrane protein [Bartonella sp. B17]